MDIPDHPQFTGCSAGDTKAGGVGVLLVNLGTPDGTDAASVRRYLREFLRDRRVIEEDTLTWKFVLNAIILATTRESGTLRGTNRR
jgi:ferrochelatase